MESKFALLEIERPLALCWRDGMGRLAVLPGALLEGKLHRRKEKP